MINNKRKNTLLIFLMLVIVFLGFKVFIINYEKKTIKVEMISKASRSCQIENCAKYSCKTVECCTCKKCVSNTSCKQCPQYYHFDYSLDHCVPDKCYVKRGNGKENEYCLGQQYNCKGFTEEVSGGGPNNCDEARACYMVVAENKYIIGKYSNQQGYEYVGVDCPVPACYKNVAGEYRWTDLPLSSETKVIDVLNQSDCVTPKVVPEVTPDASPKKDNKTLLFIIIIITVIIIALILSSLLKSNKRNYENMR